MDMGGIAEQEGAPLAEMVRDDARARGKEKK
jgi:hypothetical protein